MQIVIVHNRISTLAGKDDLDILVQVEAVSRTLSELGHSSVSLDFTLDLTCVEKTLEGAHPDIVFNLSDSLQGEGEFIHFIPTVLDHLGIPYTGCPAESIFLTSNKVLAKKIMRMGGVPTPDWLTVEDNPCVEASPGPSLNKRVEGRKELEHNFTPGRFVLKSIWEHASAGLDMSSVVKVNDVQELRELLRFRVCGCFAERYIEGREFNLSLLGSKESVMLLAPAEMQFVDFPQGTPKILGYRAKWHEDSDEYRNTRRSFQTAESDSELLNRMEDIALKCWFLFNLNGYARVDFRTDERGNPYVLEINANPCISPESGFVAAAQQSGIDYPSIIDHIILSPVWSRGRMVGPV